MRFSFLSSRVRGALKLNKGLFGNFSQNGGGSSRPRFQYLSYKRFPIGKVGGPPLDFLSILKHLPVVHEHVEQPCLLPILPEQQQAPQ